MTPAGPERAHARDPLALKGPSRAEATIDVSARPPGRREQSAGLRDPERVIRKEDGRRSVTRLPVSRAVSTIGIADSVFTNDSRRCMSGSARNIRFRSPAGAALASRRVNVS
jgi:hypothetical protein